jgi:hypothetical protein
MKEIYLVTRGSYSDYSVLGVFEDKNLAEEYAAQHSSKWVAAGVETRQVFTQDNLPAPIGFRGYYICMDRNGDTDPIHPVTTEENTGEAQIEWSDKTNKHILTGRFEFYIATDKGEEGAIKIANERRLRMIAENQWPIKGTFAYPI